MSRKIFLYNNLAGHGKIHEAVEKIAEAYADSLIVNVTDENAYDTLYSVIGTDDEIVICGGDGTLNYFVNSTKNAPLSNTIFYYAMGSGNDFLRDVDGKVDELVDVTAHLRNLPSVTVNGEEYLFINGVGFGIDGYCCEVGDKQKKKSDKPVNYTSIAINGLLFKFKPRTATVKVDGVEYTFKKTWIAPTMNGRFYGGGMMPTPAQDRHNPDGTISFLAFHGSSKLKTLMIFPSLFKGEHVKHTKHISIITGKEIEVTFDQPTSLQIDGETVLGVTSYKATAAAVVPTHAE